MAEQTEIEAAVSAVGQTDPLVLAYLAGVIDSDGFITINRSQRKGQVYHAAVVGIAGTRREPHDLAASIFGGNVGCYQPKISGHRPQFQWNRQGQSAINVIEAVYPYLRVKRANADLAAELHEHVQLAKSADPFPWFGPDYDQIAARDLMRREMIEMLNTRTRAAGSGFQQHREVPV